MDEVLNYLTIEELKSFEKAKIDEIYRELKRYFPKIRFQVELTIQYYIYDKEKT
jgi:hypothetical protein